MANMYVCNVKASIIEIGVTICTCVLTAISRVPTLAGFMYAPKQVEIATYVVCIMENNILIFSPHKFALKVSTRRMNF